MPLKFVRGQKSSVDPLSTSVVSVSPCIFFHGATAPSGPGPPHRDYTITLRHITLGRTPLDE